MWIIKSTFHHNDDAIFSFPLINNDIKEMTMHKQDFDICLVSIGDPEIPTICLAKKPTFGNFHDRVTKQGFNTCSWNYK
jgi:hypothetical protein